MINKIIWTKNYPNIKYNQLEFNLPLGYKIFSIKDQSILNTQPSIIDLGISIYSENPLILLYSKAITSNDFSIIDCHQIIPAKCSTDLFLTVINPNYKDIEERSWHLCKEAYLANMIPVDMSYTNLFEVSNSVYKTYV
jgi:hypothetical protein